MRCPESLWIEWLLSTLFDASLFSNFEAALGRLFFVAAWSRGAHGAGGRHAGGCADGCADEPHRIFTIIRVNDTLRERAGTAGATLASGWNCRSSGIVRAAHGVWRRALNTDMAQNPVEDAPISFARSFVASEAFRALFREGMGLVETTAAYLDGPGREESKSLPRMLALAYASESMRLTTRLMQLASWLLLQRAVAEGEMSSDDARRQKDKVRLAQQTPINGPDAIDALPEALQDLIAQSLRLQARIQHLDDLMEGRAARETPGPNEVQAQQRRLASAFGG